MRQKLALQLDLFCTALMFFTRIPVPRQVPFDASYLNRAARFLPAVGLVVGGLSAVVFTLSHLLLPLPIALLLSMVASVWITGAFHEDGFADMCDGFGGGWSKEQILSIMKDSRLGSYGAIGLGLMLALKFTALLHLAPALIPWALIAGHAASRLLAVSFIHTHAYVREDDSSKSKPLAQRMSGNELATALFFGLLPLVWQPIIHWWWIILPLWLLRHQLGRYLKRRIGGYTGDCLGGAQQLAEVVFYLCLLAAPWSVA